MVGSLDSYRIFAEVARCKSFSGAAKELYISQPAVSLAIMNLEKELGSRLFIRSPRGVTLTYEGQLLYEYIESAINLVNMGETKLTELHNLEFGELRIGVGDTISKYFLLPHLVQFHKMYPNINLRVINRTTPDLCTLVKSGEIDFAICNLPVDDPALKIKECLIIHDIFVCGDEFRDICSSPLSFERIAGLPLVLLERKSNSRRYVEEYILSKGVALKAEIELGSTIFCLNLQDLISVLPVSSKNFPRTICKRGLSGRSSLRRLSPHAP